MGDWANEAQAQRIQRKREAIELLFNRKPILLDTPEFHLDRQESHHIAENMIAKSRRGGGLNRGRGCRHVLYQRGPLRCSSAISLARASVRARRYRPTAARDGVSQCEGIAVGSAKKSGLDRGQSWEEASSRFITRENCLIPGACQPDRILDMTINKNTSPGYFFEAADLLSKPGATMGWRNGIMARNLGPSCSMG